MMSTISPGLGCRIKVITLEPVLPPPSSYWYAPVTILESWAWFDLGEVEFLAV